MLSPLMILSLDQGKLTTAPPSVGQFDAHLLKDIAGCIAEAETQHFARPQKIRPIAAIGDRLRTWLVAPAREALPRPEQLSRLQP